MQNEKLKGKVIILGEIPTILHFTFSILHFALCAINPNFPTLLQSKLFLKSVIIFQKFFPNNKKNAEQGF